MKAEQKETIEKYAELKITISALEAQAKELLPAVVEYVQQQNKPVELPTGKLSVINTTRWAYSPQVKALAEKVEIQIKALAEKVEIQKVEEQEKGIAKASVITTVRFTPTKI